MKLPEHDRIYAVRDKNTGKLVSNITTQRRKYWDRRVNAEAAINKKSYNRDRLELVIFDLVEVKE